MIDRRPDFFLLGEKVYVENVPNRFEGITFKNELSGMFRIRLTPSEYEAMAAKMLNGQLAGFEMTCGKIGEVQLKIDPKDGRDKKDHHVIVLDGANKKVRLTAERREVSWSELLSFLGSHQTVRVCCEIDPDGDNPTGTIKADFLCGEYEPPKEEEKK